MKLLLARLSLLATIFILTVVLVASIFYIYLNLAVELPIDSENISVQFPEELNATMAIPGRLESVIDGNIKTELLFKQEVETKLSGYMPTSLKFKIDLPSVKIKLDDHFVIPIKSTLRVEETSDLVYKHKLLPKFPMSLDVPIDIDVPVHLQQDLDIPLQIDFDGEVLMVLDDKITLNINERLPIDLNTKSRMILSELGKSTAVVRLRKRDMKVDLMTSLPLTSTNFILNRDRMEKDNASLPSVPKIPFMPKENKAAL